MTAHARATAGRARAMNDTASSLSPLRRNLVFALLMLAGVLNYADRQIIAVLKPMLQGAMRWSDSEYGFLASVFQFAAAVAYLGAGWFIDRVGWRRANPIAVGSWSLAAMAHAFTRTLAQFTAARIALGATEAMGTPCTIKTVAVLFEARARSMALSVVNVTNNAGAVITPLVVPWLAHSVGWANTFSAVGALGLVWTAAWIAVVRRAPSEQAERVAAADAPVGWSEVLKDRRTWAIAGGRALIDHVWWLLLFWTPDLLHRTFRLDMQGYGAPLAAIYAIAATGSLAGGFASGRLIAAGASPVAARKLVMLGCAILVVPAPLVLQAPSVWAAVALLGLTLGAHQGFSINLFALSADVVPNRRLATVTSLASLCGNLSGMVMLQAAGVLLQRGGGYGPLFAVIAVSYLLSLGVLQVLIRPAASGPPARGTASGVLPGEVS